MFKIKKLLPKNYFDCVNTISQNKNDEIYYKKLGWKINQFKIQFLKNNNFSIGLFKKNLMISFIIGDIITIEKKIEYEILLIYVNFNYRNKGYASKLLNEIPTALNPKNLKKIYLEVSSDNATGINLYRNNDFVQTGVRKKYYHIGKKIFDAILFEKIIYE